MSMPPPKRTGSPTGFDDISDELVEQIFEKSDCATRASLCSTAKRFRNLCRGTIYKNECEILYDFRISKMQDAVDAVDEALRQNKKPLPYSDILWSSTPKKQQAIYNSLANIHNEFFSDFEYSLDDDITTQVRGVRDVIMYSTAYSQLSEEQAKYFERIVLPELIESDEEEEEWQLADFW